MLDLNAKVLRALNDFFFLSVMPLSSKIILKLLKDLDSVYYHNVVGFMEQKEKSFFSVLLSDEIQ